MKLPFDLFAPYRPEASARIDDLKPVRIGFSGGLTFYEHPIRGDEASLIVKVDGRWYSSPWYELPDRFEVEDALSEV